LHLQLIILSVGDDVPIDSDALLVTDFVNLRLSRPSLSDVLIGVGCTCVFIGVSTCICMSIYVCTMFLKNNSTSNLLP
jgi:hypothetical protein